MKVDIICNKLVLSPPNTIEKYAVEKFLEHAKKNGDDLTKYIELEWDELDKQDIGY